ncbi:hypothetical protein HYDPIDRAFT_105364 [Hydnomerulius pinastri MD-312]|nr:hypothetical protein HYDPIDRAFT_105364 [Hydnomerulius pinastri MD-312]
MGLQEVAISRVLTPLRAGIEVHLRILDVSYYVSCIDMPLLGFFGGGGQQQPAYVQPAPAQRKGPGMGTALLAGSFGNPFGVNEANFGRTGGAGLVGGALLMDAFEDHEDNEREEAYDQGWCLVR